MHRRGKVGGIMKLHSIMLGLAVVVAPAARAEEAAAPPSPDQAAHVAEFLDIYDKGCLHAYRAGTLAAYAQSLQGRKLSREEFLARLRIEEKTGEGWAITGKSGSYFILDSQGFEAAMRPAIVVDNNEACSVFTTGPLDMPVPEGLHAVNAQFAAEANLQITKPVGTQMTGRAGTSPAFIEMQMVPDRFMIFGYAMMPRQNEPVEYRIDFRPGPAKKQ